MKKVRFILALVLALAMVLGAPLSAFAAVHDDVTTGEEVANIFNTDTDAEVVINLGGDVEMQAGLTASEGQSYTINGNGSTIADVVLSGLGSVEINADIVASQLDTALQTNGGVDVTVNGNVGGIGATDESSVAVTGDVVGGDASETNDYADVGIYASGNAEVTVDGNVTGGSGYLEDLSSPGGYSDGAPGIYAEDSATVTVNGNVTGGDSMGTYGYGADGVEADDEATITVNGNVTGGNVIADPEVEGEISLGGNGVAAGSDATIIVNGNVTGGSTNGYGGVGGAGINLESEYSIPDSSEAPEATGSVTVNGTVSGGTGGEDGISGAAIVYGWVGGEMRLVEVPAAELTEEEQEMLVEFVDIWLGSGDLTEDELQAYIEDYFGGEIPEDATLEELATLAQIILIDMLPGINDENPLLEEEYASVTVWELSDEGGLIANSGYGALSAEMYSTATTEYIIRVTQPKGGTITVDKETALEGETITITVEVEDGYTLKSVSCGAGEATDNGDGTYTFVVPAGGGVEVSAVVEAVPPAATPSTGDSFNMAFFTVLAVVSLMGICALTFTRKKTV